MDAVMHEPLPAAAASEEERLRQQLGAAAIGLEGRLQCPNVRLQRHAADLHREIGATLGSVIELPPQGRDGPFPWLDWKQDAVGVREQPPEGGRGLHRDSHPH